MGLDVSIGIADNKNSVGEIVTVFGDCEAFPFLIPSFLCLI
ncbi:hypothetical protein XBFFL1_2440003 [Xenorhabdus bovienii str. feltiae Florida]|nr:hypothetical protein XBFFR1_1040003 [Xenorhabdus bovienii str. feltiae France]CDG93255.1 hypothetical protein XBFFL1_2440003 [Xenorhabdus bovienii str. feltiae Florida]